MSVPNNSKSAALPGKNPASANSSGNTSKWKWIVVLLPLAYLWFRLIDNLQVEWTTNPQYGYGWIVPMLCAGLILRQWPLPPRAPAGKGASFFWMTIVAFMALAFLYLPTRLIEAATPEWRPLQWLLGIETIGLTLCVIYLGGGKGWLRKLAFPALFFLVAIPWPSLIEQPIIQGLTRMSALIVTELLTWLDIPTIVHGSVIEVSTGIVGIDEACSGIRSFQSSLMISLFLGEYFRLKGWQRILLVPAGFILSMAFNVGRMGFLTYIAAKKGVDAIAEYHDPAGVTIAIVCTLVLWGAGCLVKEIQFKKISPGISSCGSVCGDTRSSIIFFKSRYFQVKFTRSSSARLVGRSRDWGSIMVSAFGVKYQTRPEVDYKFSNQQSHGEGCADTRGSSESFALR